MIRVGYSELMRFVALHEWRDRTAVVEMAGWAAGAGHRANDAHREA